MGKVWIGKFIIHLLSIVIVLSFFLFEIFISFGRCFLLVNFGFRFIFRVCKGLRNLGFLVFGNIFRVLIRFSFPFVEEEEGKLKF